MIIEMYLVNVSMVNSHLCVYTFVYSLCVQYITLYLLFTGIILNQKVQRFFKVFIWKVNWGLWGWKQRAGESNSELLQQLEQAWQSVESKTQFRCTRAGNTYGWQGPKRIKMTASKILHQQETAMKYGFRY